MNIVQMVKNPYRPLAWHYSERDILSLGICGFSLVSMAKEEATPATSQQHPTRSLLQTATQ